MNTNTNKIDSANHLTSNNNTRKQQLYSYNALLHQNSLGIIHLATIKDRYTSRIGRIKSLLLFFNSSKNKEDTYMTMNTFDKSKRTTTHLLELTSFYIDIDCYNTGYSKEQVIGAIDILVYDRELPLPTWIVDSGRGLYVIWKIQNVPQKALPLWSYIQQYLYSQLEMYGADRKSLDASRILRIENSINSKNDSKVKTLIHNDTFYTINEIKKDYVDRNVPQSQPKKTKVVKRRNGKNYNLLSEYTLVYNRMKDLEKLCYIRQHDLKSYHCREYLLFLYRYYQCYYTNDPHESLEATLELNALFKQPLAHNEVARATRSAEKKFLQGEHYKYKNETLIELFDISEQEQLQLKTIIGKREKYNRNNTRRCEQRRDIDGLTKRDKKKMINIHKVQSFKNKGMSQREVSEQTKLSLRTVKNHWNGGDEMFYKVTQGKAKGKVFNLADSDGKIAIATTGEKYLMCDVAPLTEVEMKECCEIVEIAL